MDTPSILRASSLLQAPIVWATPYAREAGLSVVGAALWVTLVALLVAWCSRCHSRRKVASALALGLVAWGMVAGLWDIWWTFDANLRAWRLTEPPYPWVPRDQISTYLSSKTHLWPWHAMGWSLLLLPAAVRARKRALGRAWEFGGRRADTFVWAPLTIAGLCAVAWNFEHVFYQSFHCCGRFLDHRFWVGTEAAVALAETYRAYIYAAVSLSALCFAWRARRAFRLKACAGSLATGFAWLAVCSGAWLATADMRADTQNYFRHPAGHTERHNWAQSTAAGPLEYGLPELDSCAPIEIDRADCTLNEDINKQVHMGEQTQQYVDFRGCEGEGGVLITAGISYAELHKMHQGLAFAVAQGVRTFHIVSFRVEPTPRPTAPKLGKNHYCGRKFVYDPAGPGLGYDGKWSEFVAAVNANPETTRFSLEPWVIKLWKPKWQGEAAEF